MTGSRPTRTSSTCARDEHFSFYHSAEREYQHGVPLPAACIFFEIQRANDFFVTSYGGCLFPPDRSSSGRRLLLADDLRCSSPFARYLFVCLSNVLVLVRAFFLRGVVCLSRFVLFFATRVSFCETLRLFPSGTYIHLVVASRLGY